jgi:hypothetical protein
LICSISTSEKGKRPVNIRALARNPKLLQAG